LIAAVGFLGGPALDFGARLSRLRWSRAVGAPALDLPPDTNAAQALASAELWYLVREASALPAVRAGAAPAPGPGRVLLASARLEAGGPVAHTLRELESSPVRPIPGPTEEAPMLAFRAPEFPPRAGETVDSLVSRLLGDSSVHEWSPLLSAVRLEDPSEQERPEILEALPKGAARLLDVGCGAAATSAAFAARNPGTEVTGIERDPVRARRARALLHRVMQGDAIEVLDRLGRAGERFDAILFADVLEHLEDPVRALSLARTTASAGAVLVISVPNVGHLSVVRDLLVGRFDPVPAGLADAGHLRWFTRSSLREFLNEAGWQVASTLAVPGAPAPSAPQFLDHFSGWETLDRQSLGTYQWVVTARAAARRTPMTEPSLSRRAG
jgi:2-polyprenyl-3-methyl-5-hydroxy-6-metoxy-1,4-benzoquinol methylase